MLKGWQICRTLVFPSIAHVVERFPLEVGLRPKGKANANKFVPDARLMLSEDEEKRFVLVQVVFNAVNFGPTLQYGKLPKCETSQDNSICCDHNRTGYREVLRSRSG